MDSQKIKICLLEDVPDALGISNILKRVKIDFELPVVDTKRNNIKHLEVCIPDNILSDHGFSSFSSPESLRDDITDPWIILQKKTVSFF